jgi:hypothetical protein
LRGNGLDDIRPKPQIAHAAEQHDDPLARATSRRQPSLRRQRLERTKTLVVDRVTQDSFMTIETVDRYWTEFLIKARERFDEILDESVADCLALLDGCADNPRPVIRAWTAMRIRAQGLRRKVGEVWAQQVRAPYQLAGATERALLAQRRGEALADWMEIELHRAETSLYAELVRRLLAMLEKEQAQVRCHVCGSWLNTRVVLQTREVPCRRCNTTQEVRPGPPAILALDLGPYLWREACWELWVTKRQAEQFVRRAEEVTLAQLKAWEQAEIDYLSAWLHERNKLLPGPHDLELQRRLEQFYAGLEQQTVWTRAGCPRSVASLA